VASAAQAKIFGVPIQASFTTSANFLHDLGGNQTSTRILCLVLTILMGASTFITQRQLMARNGPAEGQMAQQQKILLYVFPVLFLFYGFKFPIGVLLYWLTTNVWSMAQQSVVIRRMDTEVPAEPAAPVVSGPAPGAKPSPRPAGGTTKPAIAGPPGNGTTPGKPPANGKNPPRPSGTRRPASRSRNRNKRGRR
jgi:YidC/Oxa1 family membrane protein insertase